MFRKILLIIFTFWFSLSLAEDKAQGELLAIKEIMSDAIKQELVRQKIFLYNPGPENIKLDLSFAQNKVIEDSSYAIERIDISNLRKNVASFMGKVTFAKNQQDKVEVKFYGKYTELVNIPVLRKRLIAGEVIDANLVEYNRIPLNRITKDIVTKKVQLIGKIVKASTQPFQMIPLSFIAEPRVIHKKDLVTIYYDSNNVIIRVKGVALEDGGVGEIISVKNLDSNQILKAKIESQSMVRVN